ncbi:hypothetical protein OAG75_01880 [bacterium]|jgi:hypothetical protein|nr:hypothetical protein [Planctomicrobium sp.]MDB4793371.1 hypothetical protein [bacterium]
MMSPVINNRFILFCLIGMTWSGCTYGPSPYGGGGYGGYPQGGYPYGSPYQGGYQNYQVPGQQYAPGGTVTPGGVYPGGTPTYQNNNGTLQPIPNNGASSDAPPYTSTEINKPVPNPSDTTGGPFYNNSNSSTFQPPIDSRSIQPAALEQEPLRPINNHLRESNASTTISGANENYSPPAANVFPAAAPMTNAIDINHPEIPSAAPINSLPSVDTIPSSNAIAPLNTEDDPFNAPIPAPAGNSSPPPEMPAFGNISNIRTNKPIVDEPEVFAHDPSYQWLRGVVSQDKPTGTWSVVYSDNPQASDEYAGHLSLASSPFLKGLEDGTIVELQGEVDPVLKDPLGKPFYLVTRLKTISAAP